MNDCEETNDKAIKALIVFREISDTDNLFAPILCDAIRMTGIDVRCSKEAFWESDTAYDIIHFQWPEEVVGWNCDDPDVIRRLEERIRFFRSRGAHFVYTRHNERPHYANDIISRAYDIIETHAQWMKSLSEIWPEHKGKGDLIDSRSKAIAKMVSDRTKDLRPEERSKVLFLFRYDARQIVTSGRNFFGQYWCDAVGARNVAESVTADNANAIVSMEQIYAWNPDVVFITNFTAATPADLFDNKMAGHDWSNVKAVKDKRVYKLPLGIYRSYTPSADTPLTLLWIAKQVYPSRFADIDLTKEVKAWYKDVFGVTLTDADVDMMFNPGEGASTGATVATRSNG